LADADLRDKIHEVVQVLRTQIKKLDENSKKLKERRNKLFGNVVNAVLKSDIEMARIYANEVVTIERFNKLVEQSKIALESVATRLETISDVNDFISVIQPISSVIKGIRNKLVDIVPEISRTMDDALGALNNIYAELSVKTDTSVSFQEEPETEQIMKEAKSIVEERTKKTMEPHKETDKKRKESSLEGQSTQQ
jgi:division protein CdvB (Snf7/Vps24/ESCRT-III family)